MATPSSFQPRVSHFVLLPLDNQHGRYILLPAVDQIVYRRKQDDAAEHQGAPVHRGRGDGRGEREEGEHEDREEEAETADVCGHTETAERPAARGQRLPADALQEHARDGDHVGRHHSRDGERVDRVKGDGGADIDKGEEDGNDERDEDSVKGDIPARFDLGQRLYVS